MAAIVISSAIVGPFAIAFVLCLFGFGCSGVIGGSRAAEYQSLIGNVDSGSCFACCQSVGSGGVMGKGLYLLIMVACGTIAAVICHYTDVFQVASHPTFESVGKSGAEQLVAFPFLILMAFI